VKRRYRAIREKGDYNLGLYTDESEADLRLKGLLTNDAELIWEIEAYTDEEAMAIYNLRMGFGPYEPMGHWQPCPKCGAPFYPFGSSECWRCGPISLEWHPCPKCGMLYPEGSNECLRCGPFDHCGS